MKVKLTSSHKKSVRGLQGQGVIVTVVQLEFVRISYAFNGTAGRLMAFNTVSLTPPCLTTLRPSLQLITVS